MTVLAAAVRYVDLGCSVIPIRQGAKRPAVAFWKPFQKQRPERNQLERWFGNGSLHQLGVVCGEVSGGLVVVDFDDAAYYHRWAKAHPDLAAKLPTVRTKRGFHLYFHSSHRKTCKLENGGHHWGEVRAEGAYVLAPPSLHPDGGLYEWLIEPAGKLPHLELAELGLDAALPSSRTPGAEGTEGTDRETEEHEAIGGDALEVEGPRARRSGRTTQDSPESGLDDSPSPQWLLSLSSLLASSVTSSDVQAIERAIATSLPTRAGHRNARVFELCRALKAIPRVADSAWQDLTPIVREWYRRALPFIRTKDFDETLEDFAHGWSRVRVPKEADWLTRIAARAQAADAPPSIARLGMPTLSSLACICVELQRERGQKPFFLACRTAGKLLHVGRTRAGKLLGILSDVSFIEVAKAGGQSSATRYRLSEAARKEAGI